MNDMRNTDFRTRTMRRLAWIVLAALLSIGGVPAAHAEGVAPAGMQTEETVPAFALHWFKEIQAGRIDRTQYAAAYATQLTDDAVKAISEALNAYGAAPIVAQVLHKETTTGQTLYIVKFVFPRGDAASFLLGFDTNGKITGVAPQSMAGD